MLPYPDQHSSLKCQLFQGDASAISGVTKLCLYVERLCIRNGEDTIVKISVAHDTPPVSFNSIEYVTTSNDLDDSVSVSCIQASSTSEAG